MEKAEELGESEVFWGSGGSSWLMEHPAYRCGSSSGRGLAQKSIHYLGLCIMVYCWRKSLPNMMLLGRL